MLSISATGNCNFSYLTGLRNYVGKAEDAMRYALTYPKNDYYYGYTTSSAASKSVDKAAPRYRAPGTGMILFAQGSEDPVKTKPYAHQFKDFIEKAGLGPVYEMPAVPNPSHQNKPGILFVWIINHDACRVWWHSNVLAEYESKKAKEKAEEGQGQDQAGS